MTPGYLGIGSKEGPSGEPVARELLLKGDFSNGVHLMQRCVKEQNEVDKHNRAVIQNWLEREQWDGILLGNIDLLGVGLLHMATETRAESFAPRRIRPQPVWHRSTTGRRKLSSFWQQVMLLKQD